MIVLDTNVLSELMRPDPSHRVLDWVSARPGTSLYTTTITRAEILYGIELLPRGRRRARLRAAAVDVFDEDLRGRVLPFDAVAADHFAVVAAGRRRAGRPISHADAQIAAICSSRQASVATRNVDDFTGCSITVVDPWSAPPR